MTINTSNVSSGSRLCENSNRTQGNLIRPAVREGAWRRWHRVVIDSQLAPAIQFAMRLKKYLRGILASAIYHMNSSILEGVNNKIKGKRSITHVIDEAVAPARARGSGGGLGKTPGKKRVVVVGRLCGG